MERYFTIAHPANFDELSQDMHLASDPERELQDGAFKEILAYCKANHLTEQYILARRFLVENPYLPHGGITITRNPIWDDEIRKWLLQAYERVPMIFRREIEGQEHIALCPRCG